MLVVVEWDGRRARALRDSMRLTVEAFADLLGVAPRTVSYWDSRSDTVPKQELQSALDTVLEQCTDSQQARFAAQVGEAAQLELVRDPIELSTRQFTADTTGVASSVGHEPIELLMADARAVAHGYVSRDPNQEFLDAAAVRTRAQDLVSRTRDPSELTELYVVIGQAGALMASVAFDLGRWPEAAQIARASTTHANRAGHASLEAWTLGLEATLALWNNHCSRALDLIEAGLTIAPPGSPRYRLRHIGARAAAAAGNGQLASALLDATQDDVPAVGGDELTDEIGGEFAFSTGRAAACAAAAWLSLGEGSGVERSANVALEYYSADAEESRAPLLGATIDLAAARLLQGDVGMASSHLRAVLSTESPDRVSLLTRMGAISRHLEDRRWSNTKQAHQLRADIGEWVSAPPHAR